MKKLLLTLVATFSFISRVHALPQDAAAPDFKAIDTNGKTHTLSENRGKYVILEWFNEGCPFVQKHYKSENMQSLQKDLTAKGDTLWFTVISSAPGKQGYGTADEHNAKMKEWNASPTAILVDENGEIGKKLGAKTTPHVFIVDPKGIVVYQGAVDDTASTDVDDVKTAKNYIRAAMDELHAGKKVTVGYSEPYGCGIKYAG